jgi:hypothetical protein
MVERAAAEAKLGIKARAHMPRHACGYKLANDGHDTRAIQAYLGHRNIQNTTRYTALAPSRFKELFRDRIECTLGIRARRGLRFSLGHQVKPSSICFPFHGYFLSQVRFCDSQDDFRVRCRLMHKAQNLGCVRQKSSHSLDANAAVNNLAAIARQGNIANETLYPGRRLRRLSDRGVPKTMEIPSGRASVNALANSQPAAEPLCRTEGGALWPCFAQKCPAQFWVVEQARSRLSE